MSQSQSPPATKMTAREHQVGLLGDGCAPKTSFISCAQSGCHLALLFCKIKRAFAHKKKRSKGVPLVRLVFELLSPATSNPVLRNSFILNDLPTSANPTRDQYSDRMSSSYISFNRRGYNKSEREGGGERGGER